MRGLVLVVLLSAGCSHARYVTKDQWGGVVAIPRDTNQWPNYNRKQAEELMAKQCPQGYEIESEQDVVVGQETHVQATVDPGSPYYPPPGQEQRIVYKRNITEHHICFRAKDTPAHVKRLAIVPPGQQTAVVSRSPLTPPAPDNSNAVQQASTTTPSDLPPAPLPVEN